MTTWDQVRNGIFAGESGGDYNALFGFANRDGGKFHNVRLTDMTVDQALQFADPSGAYGQHVKGQTGHVATPMGAYQVVGTTLKAAKDALGLTGNEVMTPELQDRIGQWIYAAQGAGAWAGYKGPRDLPPGGLPTDPQARGPAQNALAGNGQPMNVMGQALQPPQWQIPQLDPAAFMRSRNALSPVPLQDTRKNPLGRL